ncbi:MAG: SDR family NAD(P)-dependent oxidoreductase [Planctomycetota bacterium]
MAVVTGSSRGLGREIALQCAREGWNVVVNAVRSADAAEVVAEQARALGADAAVVMADVADRSDRARLIDAAVTEWGRLDCLVNNAAIIVDRPLPRLAESDWDAVMATDLLAPMDLTRRAAAAMARGGLVVNVGSICGLWGCAGSAAYSAAKGALIGFTRGAAAELAGRGVRVNAVAPGYLPTEMGRAAPAAMEIAREQHAMRTLSDPATAAAFILRLWEMPGVTGQVFNLDGRIR